MPTIANPSPKCWQILHRILAVGFTQDYAKFYFAIVLWYGLRWSELYIFIFSHLIWKYTVQLDIPALTPAATEFLSNCWVKGSGFQASQRPYKEAIGIIPSLGVRTPNSEQWNNLSQVADPLSAGTGVQPLVSPWPFQSASLPVLQLKAYLPPPQLLLVPCSYVCCEALTAGTACWHVPTLGSSGRVSYMGGISFPRMCI